MPRKKGSKNKKDKFEIAFNVLERGIPTIDGRKLPQGAPFRMGASGIAKDTELHPSDRPELLEKQIELNSLENKQELVGEPYKITLKSLGRTYKSEGETLEDALSKIKISGGAKAVAVLIVEKDGVKKDKIISGRHAQQLFGNLSSTSKELALKWARQVFDI